MSRPARSSIQQEKLFEEEKERRRRAEAWADEDGVKAFTGWLRSPTANGGKPFTKRSQTVYAAMWMKFLKETKYRGILCDEKELEGFLAHVRHKPPEKTPVSQMRHSPRQRERYLILLDTVMAYLCGIGVLKRNPAAAILARDGAREPRTEPHSLLPAEAFHLDQVMRDWPCGHWRDFRDRALLVLLLRAGVKVSECSALRPEDVELEGPAPQLVVRTSKLRRTVPLPASAVDVLRDWLRERALLEDPGERLFRSSKRPAEELSATQAYRLVKLALGRAGLNPPKVGPQLLRNTFATELLRSGTAPPEVSRQLGHRDVTSVEVFVDLIARQDGKQTRNAFPAIPKAPR